MGKRHVEQNQGPKQKKTDQFYFNRFSLFKQETLARSGRQYTVLVRSGQRDVAQMVSAFAKSRGPGFESRHFQNNFPAWTRSTFSCGTQVKIELNGYFGNGIVGLIFGL